MSPRVGFDLAQAVGFVAVVRRDRLNWSTRLKGAPVEVGRPRLFAFGNDGSNEKYSYPNTDTTDAPTGSQAQSGQAKKSCS